jgi:hypothetical protein
MVSLNERACRSKASVSRAAFSLTALSIADVERTI